MRNALVVIGLASLGLILFWLILDQRSLREKNEIERLTTMVSMVRDNLEVDLFQLDRMMHTFVTDMPEWLSSKTGQEFASRRMRAYAQSRVGVLSVRIVDGAGLVWSSAFPEEIGERVADVEGVALSGISAAPGVMRALAPVTRVDGVCSMTFAHAISVPARGFSGTLFMEMSTDAFLSLLSSVLVTDDTLSAISHASGVAFMIVGGKKILTNVAYDANTSLIHKHRASGKAISTQKGWSSVTHARRVAALATVNPIEPRLDETLTVSVGRNYDDFFDVVNQSTIAYAALYLLICALTFGLLALVGNHERVVSREYERTEERLAYQAQHDALTGLPNRSLAYDRLRRAAARSTRTGRPLVLMFIDLDNFKYVNDTFGHDAGDVVLCAIASRMLAIFRETDTLARLGGDEFIAILEDLDSLASCEDCARRLLSSISVPIPIPAGQNPTTVTVTASIGVARSLDRETSPPELMRKADQAMYRAKDAGKNRFVVYSD